MSRKISLFTTLIRTHHITSRKKLQRVKQAAAHFDVPFVLVRPGGCPGLMYAESPQESSVSSWVSAVKGLRYKDFQCVHKPAAMEVVVAENDASEFPTGAFNEVDSVATFGQMMEMKGLGQWFKVGVQGKRAGQFDNDP